MKSGSPLLYTIKLEKDGKEYHAWRHELPGCHTHGKTVRKRTKALSNKEMFKKLSLER